MYEVTPYDAVFDISVQMQIEGYEKYARPGENSRYAHRKWEQVHARAFRKGNI
ncbi:hypothetical protein Iz_47 [Brucella phage Iz]|nr:hypothetical protein Iz_47 [Brucella phage Iz]